MTQSVQNQTILLLSALGSTKDEVAFRLFRLGIQGWREHRKMCPIAVYLQGNGIVFESVGSRIHFSADVFIEPSPAVRQFMIAFDNGQYQNLTLS